MRTVSTTFTRDFRATAATRALALVRRQPAQRDGRDAVAVLHRLGGQGHGVQDGAGLIGAEVLEHRLQRGVVTDIARAQVAEQSHPGTSAGVPRAHARQSEAAHGTILFRPGTFALIAGIDTPSADGCSGTYRPRLMLARLASQPARCR